MQVTINVPEQVAADAAARGVSVNVYVEQVLEKATSQNGEAGSPKLAGEAVDEILKLRRGVTLGGAKIKDLIHEGHKY